MCDTAPLPPQPPELNIITCVNLAHACNIYAMMMISLLIACFLS